MGGSSMKSLAARLERKNQNMSMALGVEISR
jgi:hypothetical protein